MIIKEFLPNPAGIDKDGEYIKIFNDGNLPVDLSGWQIKDASGKAFKLSGNLNAGQELILLSSRTKIILNNDGERILLYDATGKLVHELNYIGQAKEGQIITKRQTTTTDNKITTEILDLNTNPITNYQFLISNNFLFLDFLTAAILATLGLYIILQLERKLDIKLW